MQHPGDRLYPREIAFVVKPDYRGADMAVGVSEGNCHDRADLYLAAQRFGYGIAIIPVYSVCDIDYPHTGIAAVHCGQSVMILYSPS